MPASNEQMQDLNKKSKMKSIAGGALNYGFIGVDSAMRIKDGESAPVAIGKAVLTNAAFNLIPGKLPMALALGAVAAAPALTSELNRAARGMNGQKQMFYNNFQETTGQMDMLNTGMSRLGESRTHLTRQMANHARGAAKVY